MAEFHLQVRHVAQPNPRSFTLPPAIPPSYPPQKCSSGSSPLTSDLRPAPRCRAPSPQPPSSLAPPQPNRAQLLKTSSRALLLDPYSRPDSGFRITVK